MTMSRGTSQSSQDKKVSGSKMSRKAVGTLRACLGHITHKLSGVTLCTPRTTARTTQYQNPVLRRNISRGYTGSGIGGSADEW